MGRRLEGKTGKGLFESASPVPRPAHKSVLSASLGFHCVLLRSFPPPCLDPGGGAKVAARPVASPAQLLVRCSTGLIGPCRLSQNSLNYASWHRLGASALAVPGWNVPTLCASRRAQHAIHHSSTSRVVATASSLQGPPRTRGATSVETSSGASCARAYSARVSSGPTQSATTTGGQRQHHGCESSRSGGVSSDAPADQVPLPSRESA